MRLTKRGQKRNCGETELVKTDLTLGSKILSRSDLVGFRLSGKDGGSNYHYKFELNKKDIHAIILAVTQEYRNNKVDDLSVVAGFIELLSDLSPADTASDKAASRKNRPTNVVSL